MKVAGAAYKELRTKERVVAVMNALGRKDEEEAHRLIGTCRREMVNSIALDYQNKAQSMIFLFFTLNHWGWKLMNLTRRSDKDDEELRAIIDDAMKLYLSVYWGWVTFCDEVGLKPEAMFLAFYKEEPAWFVVARIYSDMYPKDSLPLVPFGVAALHEAWNEY